ncbi:MAG: hypothetical protein PGN29_14120 [Gordonia paraffinivorans]
MGARMEIDTTRVGVLARDLAVAADRLHAAARSTAAIPAPRPSAPAWADVLTRHAVGVGSVADLLTGLADRAASVADALVAAVGTTTTQDADTARAVARALGEQR